MKTFTDIHKLLKKATKKELTLILEIAFDMELSISKQESYELIIDELGCIYDKMNEDLSSKKNEVIFSILNKEEK